MLYGVPEVFELDCGVLIDTTTHVITKNTTRIRASGEVIMPVYTTAGRKGNIELLGKSTYTLVYLEYKTEEELEMSTAEA